jgi:PAS domain S-box-containing protein
MTLSKPREDREGRPDSVAPALPGEASVHHGHGHTVQFYDDETFLATVVSDFLAGGLKAGQPVIVVATPEHRAGFLRGLSDCGIDVGAVRRSGQLRLADARQTLRRFTVSGRLDADRFRTVVGTMIDRSLAGREGSSIRAYGEMVDLLWKDGDTEGAIQLEKLWNELAKSYDFSLLCAYSMGNFCRATDAEHFRQVCAEHAHVVPAESYSSGSEASRLLEISLLQQRGRAYEAEVAQREQVEQRLRDAVIELHDREADLRDVLENAAEGIHLVGPDGVILWANNAELEMLGYEERDYVGHHIADFHVDRPVVDSLLERLAAGETLRGIEVRLRHKDGSIRHILVNSNVRWHDGRFVHTRCFNRDITALRAVVEERESLLERERGARADAEQARVDAVKARALAEQANRAKSEFLAVMSHELRTPLNAIGGYAELMELGIHGPITAQQREALDRIQRSQRLLLGLINQVLNYARVETGNIRYDLADVWLDEALRSAEGLVAPQLRAKALRYAYSGCDGDVAVHVDSEKLQQIVLNLLTNALKFTDRGGTINVAVECTAKHAMVHVSDTGIGIPRDKLDVIFDPFVQVDANYTRTRDGVGLGLAISRDLARGMGGELTVRSTHGAGSTFTLTIARSA